MTTTTIITITAIAGISIGLASCSLLRKSTGKSEETVEKVAWGDKILLHMHPEKVLNYLPDLKDVQIAYLFGMTLEEYQKAKKEYDDQAKNSAASLLNDSAFAKKVDLLPFRKEETILILGESTTDALNSWATILNYALQKRRPQDNLKVINGGISGQTTTEALKRIIPQLKQNPDWVICFLGGNDCMRYGGEDLKTCVSVSETMNNLRTIEKIISKETKAKIIWMAPAPINENKASFFPPFKQMKLTIKNEDLLIIGNDLIKQYPDVIDLRGEFGVPAKGSYMQFDGVHLSIEGQELIVKKLINGLIKAK